MPRHMSCHAKQKDENERTTTIRLAAARVYLNANEPITDCEAKESGAYYQNKKKVKEENIKRNVGALLKLVKVSETTECTPASPESTPGPSGVSTVKTSDVRNQELNQIEQDTNDSQPLIDSNNLSDSNTFTEDRVEESFINFIEIKSKTVEDSDMIVRRLKADGHDIMNCRGQAYDNAATMTLLEENRAEFVDVALQYAKSLCEELGISFEPPRLIRRRHIFGNGTVDVGLSYENELRRIMFTSLDRVTAEIRDRFQQLQNLAQNMPFNACRVVLGLEELNLDQALRDINREELQHERAHL
ncbi:hypothetical protein EVAR_48809_1 [Eumeta japonica]|uniref:Uncharacterized protein n=1 Tax=Eumeta variegata TaxID=151549 RepID=A0A4C1Y3N9_EUMVA|nr:hypothetical protein EVAR_48809_1 [Eumeta japonica]